MKPDETHPVVSVITVCYNAASYIEKTIVSVLGQSYPHIQYIIVDGGSTDETLAIIGRYKERVCLISEKDQGIYDAMNKGMRRAEGEWLNFLNGGDEYHDKATLSSMFTRSEIQSADFVYGDSINRLGDFQKYIKAPILSMERLKSGLGACHQSMFVRRLVSPPYRLEFKYKAEYYWVIEIFQSIAAERVLYIPIPVVYYELGGFSERGLLKNLNEFISITKSRFGWMQVLKNIPVYTIIWLRHFKYKIAGY